MDFWNALIVLPIADPISGSRLGPRTSRARAASTWIVETKGAETVEVAYKDRAARLWCENATMLTGTMWEYIKVPQKDFYEMQPALFSDITLMR